MSSSNEETLSPLHAQAMTAMRPYAGFWLRSLALLYDYLALLPIGLLSIWLLSHSQLLGEVGLWVNYLSFPVYTVVLHAVRGQSLGKMATCIRVEHTDGRPIGWAGALVRFAPLINIRIVFAIMIVGALRAIPEEQFAASTLMQKSALLVQHMHPWWPYVSRAFQIWLLAEIVTLLATRRRQAIHDFIAATVVRRLDQAEA
jgi:uncharacterized RDD family membrane protein YckC